MKLVKLQDNTSRKLSSIELLMSTIYGSTFPAQFVPGASYRVGDKVYAYDDTKGTIVIKVCTANGVYNDTNGFGWSIFNVVPTDDNKNVDYSEFVPGNEYTAGNKQIVIGDFGEVTIYECIESGVYDTIKDGGWKNIPFDNNGDIDGIISTVFNVPMDEYVEGNMYSPDSIVYIINESTGSVTLYENSGDDATNNTPPNEPWVLVDASEYIKHKNPTVNINFATDEDVREMFGATEIPGDCDCGVCNPDNPNKPDNDDGDISWEEF